MSDRKYNNQVTEHISNTDSISFIASLGYKVLGVTRGRNRADDRYRLRDENKMHAEPFTLYRRHFYQRADKYHLHAVKVIKTRDRAPTNACADYDLFSYGVL